MPRKKNLDLAAELGEDVDVTEAEANAAREIVPDPTPPAPPVVSASTPIALTLDQIQALMASATAGSAANNAALADAVTQGIAQARKPIPEGTDASNPRISVFNPLGDRDHPRPLLKCDFFLGTTEGKSGQIQRSYPYLDGDLTVNEVIALNTLEPTTTKIELYDGTRINLSIVADRHPVTDTVQRMMIVIPATVTGKGSQLKNMLPSPIKLVQQITGKDYATLSNDDLAWFMAEHRAKRYVSVREAVAA